MSIALPRPLRRLFTDVSLSWVLTVPFVLPTIGTVALVGYLAHRSGQEAAADLGRQLVSQTNERVTQELKTYLQTPLLVNRLNVDAVNQKQLDVQNIPELEAALLHRLQQFDQVSAVLFASPQGTFRFVERFPTLYLGAADPPRPDDIKIYSLDNQGRREKLAHEVKGLDVRRDRPFYRRAVTTGKPGWNPIARYGNSATLTLDASQPVYDSTSKRLLGVFAVHVRLEYLSQFLHRLDISRVGQIIITDQSGTLIATSTQERPYSTGDKIKQPNQFQQLKIYQSQNKLTRFLGEYLRNHSELLKTVDQTQYLEFNYSGEPQYLQIAPFQDQHGLDWRILTVIPKSHFLGAIQNSVRTTVLLCLLTLGGAITLGLVAANRFTARFAQLARVSRELAAGNLDRRLPTDQPIFELKSLAQVFNQMADQLQQSFDRVQTALEESEARFTTVFRTSPDPMAIASLAEGRILEVNNELLKFFGYSRFEMIGRTALELNLWNNLAERDQYRALLQQQGSVLNLEVQLRTKLGEVKTVLLSAEARTLEGQDCVIVVHRDISSRKADELALQQSEARYRAIVEDQTELICRSLPDTTRLFVNDAYCRYFGIQREDLIGKSAFSFVDAEDRDRVTQLIHSLSLTNPTVIIENRVIVGGKIRWTQWINRLLFDAEGNVTEMQSVGRDITELKQIEAALRKSEASLLQAQQIAHLGSWEFDPVSQNVTWSEELFRIFGVDPAQSEPSYADIMAMIPDRERDILSTAINQAIVNGSPYEVEHRICRPDGTIRYAVSKGQVWLNDQQQISKLYGIVLDITARKQAEAALRQSEERFRQLAETVQEGFFVYEVESAHYSYVNPAYEAMIGTLQWFNQRISTWLDRVHPDDRARIKAALQQEKQGKNFNEEYRFTALDGEMRWLRSKAFPLSNETGVVVRVVGTVEDITDRKRAEVEIQQLNQQLTHRVNELQTLFNVLPVGVAISEDPECRIARVNPCLAEILRVPVDANASPSAPDAERPAYRVHRDGQEVSSEDLPMQYAAAHDVDVQDEIFEIVHPDGTVIQLLCYASPLRDGQGKVRGVIGGFVNITDRKRAEIALQESEARFQEIARTISQVFFVLSATTGQYLYVSPAYERLWGDTCESLYQNPNSWLNRVHPEDLEAVLQQINQSPSKQQVNYEYRIIHPDGNLRWISSEFSTVCDVNDKALRIVGFAEDITDRKRAEEALQESEERFREIAQTLNQVSYVISLTTGQYLYISPSYERVWGYSCESLYQNPNSWLERIHPEDLEYVSWGFNQLLAGNQVRLEYRIICANDEIHWIKSESLVVYDENGSPLRIVGLADDITERKRLEQSLRSQAEEERLLAAITQHIRQSLDLDQILATTVVEVQQMLNADRVLIFRLNQNGSGQVIQEAVISEYPITNLMRWMDECFPYECYNFYRQGIPRIVPDVTTDVWADCLAEFMQEVGVKSKIVAPIVQVSGESNANVWGLLIVHACSHRREWQASEANLLQKICNQLVIAIDQANLYQQLQTELTERKQAEAALKEREAMLRAIGDNLPRGYIYQCTYKPEGGSRYSYVSAGIERLLGLKPEDVMRDASILHTIGFEEDLTIAKQVVQQAIQNRTPFELQMRNRAVPGKIQWSSIRETPRQLEDGRVVWDGVEVDITDLKLTEAALRASEEQFRRAFDDAPIGVSLVSTMGQYVKVNSYYCDLLGYTEAELLSFTFQDITHPEDRDTDLAGFQQMISGEIRSFQMEKRYITKQGVVIPVLINAAPIRDQDGKALYVVGHIQDIRDRLKVERLKDEFISVVSHELRTPLTSIRGALGILGSGIFNERPEKAQHMLQIALNNSDRLVRLVNDILSLERLESGKVQLVMEHCQVAELMQQAIDSVQALADQSGVTLLSTLLSASLWASPDAIIQTLTNLLSNAIKFSAPGDTVWLTADMGDQSWSEPPPPFILFTVKDRGRGIPEDKLQVIFEQFQQVDVSDSRKKGGTGLGLAICKKIVQQHSGQIWAESRLGEGSTFYVALPLIVKDGT